jgi:hypothetical protein
MVRRLAAILAPIAFGLLLGTTAALAQQPPASAPVPLFPTPPPASYREEKLPPIAPAAELPRFPDPPPAYAPPPDGPPRGDGRPPGLPANSPAATTAPADARVFCAQPVTVRIADRDAVPERYRGFVGMWSDAAWTPLLCAALIVENVTQDGMARIVYAFGPLAKGTGAAQGGVLNGTGIIRDGELRFQNSDGSQFAFRPMYSDLDGRLTTPQGQSYQAVFKKTL